MDFNNLLLFFIFIAIAAVNGNTEGDVLANWKNMLRDPNGLLHNWDPNLVDPCTWFHVTCNPDNSVTRVDLGNTGLSGALSPLLSKLTNLQYFDVYENNLTGVIPPEFGELTNLVSLNLNDNKLSGSIPSSLAKLKSLRFLRLNSNKLTGDVSSGILELTKSGNLLLLNVSDNLLNGQVPPRRSKGLEINTKIQDPKGS